MTTSIIYRIEHKEDGLGPYRTEYEHTGIADAHMGCDDHPTPAMESYSYWCGVHEEHSFGCSSREKLDRWFKDFKEVLHEEGFVIRVFEAPTETVHVSPSGKQVYFTKSEAKEVDTLDLVQ